MAAKAQRATRSRGRGSIAAPPAAVIAHRIKSLLLADRELTPAEWAEIEAAKSGSEPVENFPALLASIDLLHPLAAGKLVERLIERMDAAQGDADLEDGDEDACHAHDDDPTPAGTPSSNDYGPGDPDDAEDSHDQEAIDDREPEAGVMMPRYAIDQSVGPVNEAAANRDRELRERAMWAIPSNVGAFRRVQA